MTETVNETAGVRRSQCMRLADLVTLLDAEYLGEDLPVEITGVQDDSRRVLPGDLFVAVVGINADGHEFAAAAIKRGASAIVVEHRLDLEIPQVIVPSASHALGILAAEIAGRPADQFTKIGITGTNGKTTTTYLVESILETAKRSPGVIGTVGYRWGGKEIPAPYTTPTPLVLQEAFLAMQEASVNTAILEVSSAALHMDRLVGTRFNVAAFSNLSQDHLDVHNTMKEYRDAKARLFLDHLEDSGIAVINIDDAAGAHMAAAANGHRILRVSRNPGSDAEICVQSFRSTIDGIVAEISTPRGLLTVESDALIGHYNVDNIALAVGIGEALNIPHRDIAKGIAGMSGVPGRVQRVENFAHIDIFVDYAHTPDALINVLSALRPLTKKRLLCVFGCGGDRDPSKRPAMGAAVAEAADLAIVTSDNPRTEDPLSILDAITPSVPNAFFVDVDRRVAISAAIAEATPGDVVLIAGKGHEDYQIIGTEKVHFDDCEEAKYACEARVPLNLQEILNVTNGALLGAPRTGGFNRVIIDGRRAAIGDLYVAICGEQFDGHDYCQQAIDAGATGIIVARGRGEKLPAIVIEVDDPRIALGQIARHHRESWDGIVIGVTGSAGKTTTKDLIAAALRKTGRVHAAAGSNNNETGVPLTLLGLRPYHDFAVIEMGMRALGEIEYLANIALPTVQLVLNAGTAHVGELGSTDAIAQAKGEIYGGQGSNNTAIFPAEDKRLANYAQAAHQSLCFADATDDSTIDAGMRLMRYTPAGPNGCRIEVAYGCQIFSIALPLIGKHNAINACAALLCAIAAGASPADAATSIETVHVPAMRGEVKSIAGRNILMDCYNANPASVQAALTTLSELRGEKKAFAVLGDMLELGQAAATCHLRVGKQAATLGIPLLALGEFRNELVRGATDNGGVAWPAETPTAAARAILASTGPGDWILLKASRGMKLERVAEAIANESSNK